VFAWDWPTGVALTLTIDDPTTTSQNPDYTTTGVASAYEDWEHGFFLGDIFDIQPGDLVTVSGANITKQHIVTHITVTKIDIDADTVSGTANSGSIIHVGMICDESGCADRNVPTNESGNWLADFSIPVQDPSEGMGTFDLRSESGSSAYEPDDDWDNTKVNWSVPSIPANRPPVSDAGGPYSVYASSTFILDASNSSDPDGDMLTYEWDLDNDGLYDDASGVTATTSFNQAGDHVIGLRVTDEGGLSDADTATVTVLPWTLKGFYQPVDMNGVYNVVKKGSTVPFKFEIFAGPTELTDISSIKSFTSTPASCATSVATDDIEQTAADGTSLRYDATAGQFIYNLKMLGTAGKCTRVTMTTIDGSSLVASFKLK